MEQSNGVATVEARVFDRENVPCLDATNVVRFGLTGDGQLLDNLGTATGSRVVQLCNGRARISLQLTGGQVVASVAGEGLATQFLAVTNASGTTPLAKRSSGGKGKGKSRPAATAWTPTVDVAAIDRDRILKAARVALAMKPVTITAFPAKFSEGGVNDFYSNGDYWWPNPKTTNGLPYVQRDGQTNPDNFIAHRQVIRQLRDAVAALGAAYKITGEDHYAAKAADLLRVFFLAEKTRMNPSLQYAQAVPGVSPGRGTGIIDTLHLVEIPKAVAAMEKSPAFPPEVLAGMKKWFADYVTWMTTSKNGREEGAAKNNHAVAFWLQVAVFADFVRDEARLAECRRQFTEVFVPKQMTNDGGFPRELARTKPYGYSIFQLDNMVTLCQVLSTQTNDLWQFTLSDGRGIRRSVEFLYPYLADKSRWSLPPDVNAWDSWPARQPHLLFAGLAFGEPKYLDLWQKLPADPANEEVRRNIAITQPVLWVKASPVAKLTSLQ
jgi:hypothetical protein